MPHLRRPWQTFDGIEVYPDSVLKAAAILKSIILNYLYLDGNKRTAFLLCKALPMQNGYSISAATQNIFDFLIDISTGKIKFNAIAAWLEQNNSTIL